ncbi:hypothetical protein LPN04_21635 [Rugamonas sp. A1-17]|nr:hypothetical protein [Rugamonas sp. A1-17]
MKSYAIFYDWESHRVLVGMGGQEPGVVPVVRPAGRHYFPGGSATGKGMTPKNICTYAALEIAQEVGKNLKVAFDFYKDTAAIHRFQFGLTSVYFVVCYVNRLVMDCISEQSYVNSTHGSRFSRIVALSVPAAARSFRDGGPSTSWFVSGLSTLPTLPRIYTLGGANREEIRGQPTPAQMAYADDEAERTLQHWDLFGLPIIP